MYLLGTLLAIVGSIMMMVFGIIMLIKAFQKSVLWGLGSLILGIPLLILVIQHWAEYKGPFLKYVLGAVFAIVGFGLMAPTINASLEELEGLDGAGIESTP